MLPKGMPVRLYFSKACLFSFFKPGRIPVETSTQNSANLYKTLRAYQLSLTRFQCCTRGGVNMPKGTAINLPNPTVTDPQPPPHPQMSSTHPITTQCSFTVLSSLLLILLFRIKLTIYFVS